MPGFIVKAAADEDALEQVSRPRHDRPASSYELDSLTAIAERMRPGIGALPMAARTRWFQKNQWRFAARGADWQWSLRALGTCCYHGAITPSAIVKTITWNDHHDMVQMALLFDPTITVVNYGIKGAFYRWAMQELAGVDTGHEYPNDNPWFNPDVMYALFHRTTHIDVRVPA